MIYDTIIIGAGPAGLTASIYASRYKMSNLIIGKMVGGTITYAHKVDNFPGLPSITGAELGKRMADQAKGLGAEILTEEVEEIRKEKTGKEGPEGQEMFRVKTRSGKGYLGKTLIVAAGTERRKLNIPGEKEFLGHGVSYCTTCDAPFYKNKTVVLVGGSNAACSGASFLADYAEKVYLIYRRNELRAEPIWIEEVKKNPKIEVIYNTNIIKILGNQDKVAAVELDKPFNGENILKTDGVFIEIGGIPNSFIVSSLGVDLNDEGYIKVDEKMHTNVPGLFAAGDFTTNNLYLQQTITACADGARAAASALRYIKGQKAPSQLGNSL